MVYVHIVDPVSAGQNYIETYKLIYETFPTEVAGSRCEDQGCDGAEGINRLNLVLVTNLGGSYSDCPACARARPGQCSGGVEAIRAAFVISGPPSSFRAGTVPKGRRACRKRTARLCGKGAADGSERQVEPRVDALNAACRGDPISVKTR